MYIATLHNCQRLETTQKSFSGLVYKLQYIHSLGTTQQKVKDYWQKQLFGKFSKQ